MNSIKVLSALLDMRLMYSESFSSGVLVSRASYSSRRLYCLRRSTLVLRQ